MSNNTRTAVAVVVAVATVTALAAVAGFRMPWSDHGDILDGQQQMNADNAKKILDSPDLRSFALPTGIPPGLEYLTVVHAEEDHFEMASQQHGLFYTVCDSGGDTDSACDQETAHIVRDVTIDGRRVQVAEISPGVDADKITDSPTAAERDAVLAFWKTVELTRGGASEWVSALAQRPTPRNGAK